MKFTPQEIALIVEGLTLLRWHEDTRQPEEPEIDALIQKIKGGRIMVKVIYESSAMYDLLSMGYTLVRVTAAGHAFLMRGGATA